MRTAGTCRGTLHLTVAEPLPWMRTLAQAHDALGGADPRGSRARACSTAPRRVGFWRINKRGCSVQAVGLGVHKIKFVLRRQMLLGQDIAKCLPPAGERGMHAGNAECTWSGRHLHLQPPQTHEESCTHV